MRYAIYLLLLPGLSAPALAQDSSDAQDENRNIDLTVLAGTDYVRGQIEGQDYETVSASAGVAIAKGRFSLSASVPYLVTTAPENLIVSQGGLLGSPIFATPVSQSARVRREGVGDLSLQAAYHLPVRGVEATIAGSAKVPTASRQKGLGSGEFDYGVSGRLSKSFGSIIPFVSAGYTIVGQPEGFTVRNTLSGSAGARFRPSQSSMVSLSYAYEQSATDIIGDRQSVGVGLGTQLAPRL
jgi:hypothetical protein